MSDERITVERPSEEHIEALGASEWPIWTKEISRFDWHYDDREICLLLEGEVVVRTDRGAVRFGAGDLVTFEQGLDCNWEVLQPVRKHYRFG